MLGFVLVNLSKKIEKKKYQLLALKICIIMELSPKVEEMILSFSRGALADSPNF